MLDLGQSNHFRILGKLRGAFLLRALAFTAWVVSMPFMAHADDAAAPLSPQMFSTVFQEITTYHLNPPPAKQLFYNTVSILQKTDPQIQTRENEHLVIYYSHRPQFAFKIPGLNDAIGWGNITQTTIERLYTQSKALQQLSKQELAQNVVSTMLKTLDQYSHLSSNSAASTQNWADRSPDMPASIGVTVTTDGSQARVTALLPNGPAKNYLRVGDIITRIDDRSIQNMRAKDIVSQFRGSVDSPVKLSVLRGNEQKEFILRRAALEKDSFSIHEQSGILFLQISRFNLGLADKIKNQLGDEPKNYKGIVVDLRGNRGGVLSEATAVADLFLSKGLMISMRGRHPDSTLEFAAQHKRDVITAPMAVLIDGQTASAAEVLAAALQDNRRAVVIGSNSYGKGLVQRATYVEGLGQLAITWSELYKTSNYKLSLNHNGVHPNVCLTDTQLSAPNGLTPAPDRFVIWLRRAPQVTWDSKSCDKAPRKDNAFDMGVARDIVLDPALYNKLLNNIDNRA